MKLSVNFGLHNFSKRFNRQSDYYGFVDAHGYLSDLDLKSIKERVFCDDTDLVRLFEAKFAQLIGTGDCVSYATGRMGFYDLMRTLKITDQDEVIVLGFTCSVMINAISRVGAVPVFSDLNISSFGSGAVSVEELISSRTKLIVVQHSFGIPCEIDKIMKAANSRNIFVLEDCALSLGSSLHGKPLGSFGHAALFSTDHSKPINTMVGGLIYSEDSRTIENLKLLQEGHATVSKRKRLALWEQILLERFYCDPVRSKSLNRANRFQRLAGLLTSAPSPFFDDDHGLKSGNEYGYPTKMPSFIAELGLFELSNWDLTAFNRKRALKEFTGIFNRRGLNALLPASYLEKSVDIVPLRLVWHVNRRDSVLEHMGDRFDVSGIWFFEPLSGAKQDLAKAFYKAGTCPEAEGLCKRIINIPCYRDWSQSQKMLLALEGVLANVEGIGLK